MKTKVVFQVFHTSENGADYVEKTFNRREDAVAWEHANRSNYPRPLIIKKQTYKY